MLYIVIVMLAILVVAGVVVLYAAFPHRGERLPAVPWLGRAMSRAVGALPTLAPEEAEETEGERMHFHR